MNFFCVVQLLMSVLLTHFFNLQSLFLSGTKLITPIYTCTITILSVTIAHSSNAIQFQAIAETNAREHIKLNFNQNESEIKGVILSQVVITRLRIVHTKATKSHILSRGPPTTCQHCGQTLTLEHMLQECTVLQHSRDEHYAADSLGTLFETIPEACIVEFLR